MTNSFCNNFSQNVSYNHKQNLSYDYPWKFIKQTDKNLHLFLLSFSNLPAMLIFRQFPNTTSTVSEYNFGWVTANITEKE